MVIELEPVPLRVVAGIVTPSILPKDGLSTSKEGCRGRVELALGPSDTVTEVVASSRVSHCLRTEGGRFVKCSEVGSFSEAGLSASHLEYSVQCALYKAGFKVPEPESFAVDSNFTPALCMHLMQYKDFIPVDGLAGHFNREELQKLYFGWLNLLNFYHARGLLDPDTKLENVGYDGSDFCFFDFGAVMSYHLLRAQNRLGKTYGTPVFISPEQQSTSSVSEKSTTFQFALSFLLAAFNEHPLEGGCYMDGDFENGPHYSTLEDYRIALAMGRAQNHASNKDGLLPSPVFSLLCKGLNFYPYRRPSLEELAAVSW